MTRAVRLCITVLELESDVLCEVCGVPCAVTVTYVAEESHEPPHMVHRLTYCETCDQHQTIE